MEEIGIQIGIVVGVLVASFSGPAIAFFFLHHRKRRVRAMRRSPIGQNLLRAPGHSVREQLEDASGEVTFDVMLLMFMPVLILAIFFAQGHVRGLANMGRLAPIYALLIVGFIAFMVRKLIMRSKQMDNLRAGFDAELAVGQELDQLMRQGAIVFHDFPAEKFNIDHVVIANQGVFAIETKGFTKDKNIRGKASAKVVFNGKSLSFPWGTTSDPIEQAERQATWLATWLNSAIGSGVPVVPVLTLPGWFVERTGRGIVRVYSGKELAGLLKTRGTSGISAQDMQRISHQVEQRCRTVSPRYRDDD